MIKLIFMPWRWSGACSLPAIRGLGLAVPPRAAGGFNPIQNHNEKCTSQLIKQTYMTTCYTAEVTSDRTNLSPFTKDYRGVAFECALTDLCVARESGKKNIQT